MSPYPCRSHPSVSSGIAQTVIFISLDVHHIREAVLARALSRPAQLT